MTAALRASTERYVEQVPMRYKRLNLVRPKTENISNSQLITSAIKISAHRYSLRYMSQVRISEHLSTISGVHIRKSSSQRYHPPSQTAQWRQ
jgi:hypothetical protein